MEIEELIKNPQKWADVEREINKLLKENNSSIKDLIKKVYPLADKKGKKFLKKVVHILSTRGIEVEVPEEKAVPVWKPLQTVKTLLCGSFDAKGIMPMAFCMEKGDFSASLVTIHYKNGIETIDDEEGLKKNPLSLLKTEWEKTGFFTYEMPYEHGLYHLKKALARGGKRILPFFISYDELKELNYEPSKEIPFENSPMKREVVEVLAEINYFLPLAMLLSDEEISQYLEEYENISNSPIILTGWTKREREMEIIKRIIREGLDDKRDAYADFFIECGIMAMKKGAFDSAALLKEGGLGIRDERTPSEENPFLQSIVKTSLEFWKDQKRKEGIIKL